jgi:Zn-finger nucleic acid-binding protein
MTFSLPGRGLSCPYCLAIMQPMQQGKLPIDVCIACGTRWFDHAVLAPMVSENPAHPRLGIEETPDLEDVEHTCPRCRTATLLPHRLGDVQFRRCTTCEGVEIPSGNLDKILRQLPGPGSRLPGGLRELFDVRPPAVSS